MLVNKSKKNYTMKKCEITHKVFIIKDLQKRKTPLFGALSSVLDFSIST